MSEREPIEWVAGRYGVSYSAWQGGQRVGCVYRVDGSAWCLSIDAPRGTGPGARPALTRRVVCHSLEQAYRAAKALLNGVPTTETDAQDEAVLRLLSDADVG